MTRMNYPGQRRRELAQLSKQHRELTSLEARARHLEARTRDLEARERNVEARERDVEARERKLTRLMWEKKSAASPISTRSAASRSRDDGALGGPVCRIRSRREHRPRKGARDRRDARDPAARPAVDAS